MNSTAKRILTALWVAGAFAGLLAVIVLPGRYDSGGPVLAHTTVGVEIIDTAASCESSGHNLDNVNNINEVQTVTIAGASISGTFTLSFGSTAPTTTSAIAFDATAAQVETALELLGDITDVTVTGTIGASGGTLTVTFLNPGNQNVALMTFDDTSLTNGTITMAEATAGQTADCTAPNAFDDAVTSDTAFLNADTDGDTVFDTIAVTPGTTVRVAAHARSATDDKADGIDVTWTATGSAVIQAKSIDAGSGALTGGLLSSIGDTQTTIADTVSDFDGGGASGTCDAAADTCINNGTANDPDGISIIEVKSGLPTSATITATTLNGSDSVTIIWTGTITKVNVTSTDVTKLIPQSVIAREGDAVTAGGDPDSTITATGTDSNGNPVAGADIDCTLDTAGGARADILAAQTLNNGVVNPAGDPGGNSVLSQTTNTNGVVQLSLEAESEAGDSKGDVTVTCWWDADGGDDLDGTEPSGSVTVRVAGVATTVDMGPDVKVTVGSVDLSAQVTDNTGGGVADGTDCAWALIDPAGISALIGPTLVTADGKVSSTLFVSGAGTVSVIVTCDSSPTNVTGSLVVQVNADGVGVFPPGDLDCDGTFTVADLLAGARALVGLDPALTACSN